LAARLPDAARPEFLSKYPLSLRLDWQPPDAAQAPHQASEPPLSGSLPVSLL
jgi:hypothetical protein